MDQDLTVTAAFMALGLGSQDQDLLEAWNQGHLELIHVVVSYAPYLNTLMVVAAAAADGYPGVFDYEVSEQFGSWFAKQILEGHIPTDKEVRVYLVKEVYDFFVQNIVDAVQSSIIQSDLMDVKFNRRAAL